MTDAERRLAARGAKRITALVKAERSDAAGFWEAVGYGRDHRMTRYVKTVNG